MPYTILRIILDVVVLSSPLPCGDWMVPLLPFAPTSSEAVRFQDDEQGGCLIRYQSPEIAIPGPEFHGV